MSPLLKSQGNRPRTGKIKKCLECGKEVYRSPSALGRKYCSLNCYNKAQTRRPDSICKQCGGLYWVAPSKTTQYGQKYCSVECYRDSNPRRPKTVGTRRKGLLAAVDKMAKLHARLRDCGGRDRSAACISCGSVKPFAELDGGHFIPSTCSALRFDERNIHAQCHRCNRFMHGAQANYMVGLERKLDRATVDELLARQHEIKKWTAEELDELYDYYRRKLKELED